MLCFLMMSRSAETLARRLIAERRMVSSQVAGDFQTPPSLIAGTLRSSKLLANEFQDRDKLPCGRTFQPLKHSPAMLRTQISSCGKRARVAIVADGHLSRWRLKARRGNVTKKKLVRIRAEAT
jgi:hypothetical protein